MPKNKTKGPETPAPITTTNPFLGMSQETRWLLSRQIDEQIAGLERTAQELLGIKHQLISAGIQAAENQQAPGMVSTTLVAVRKRGRPPGSKNKPKREGTGEGTGEVADPVNPAQGTMFEQAVEATRPEYD